MPQRWREVAPGVVLTPDGAAWLPEAHAFVVADVDIAPRDASAVADRILAIAARLSARRLVVAGALAHSARDVDDDRLDAMNVFRTRLAALERVDFLAGTSAPGGRESGTTAALRIGGVEVRHAPPAHAIDRWVVCGSLRPVLRESSGKPPRPCALVGPRVLVLPAFGSIEGTDAELLLAGLAGSGWRAIPVADGATDDRVAGPA